MVYEMNNKDKLWTKYIPMKWVRLVRESIKWTHDVLLWGIKLLLDIYGTIYLIGIWYRLCLDRFPLLKMICRGNLKPFEVHQFSTSSLIFLTFCDFLVYLGALSFNEHFYEKKYFDRNLCDLKEYCIVGTCANAIGKS